MAVGDVRTCVQGAVQWPEPLTGTLMTVSGRLHTLHAIRYKTCWRVGEGANILSRLSPPSQERGFERAGINLMWHLPACSSKPPRRRQLPLRQKCKEKMAQLHPGGCSELLGRSDRATAAREHFQASLRGVEQLILTQQRETLALADKLQTTVPVDIQFRRTPLSSIEQAQCPDGTVSTGSCVPLADRAPLSPATVSGDGPLQHLYRTPFPAIERALQARRENARLANQQSPPPPQTSLPQSSHRLPMSPSRPQFKPPSEASCVELHPPQQQRPQTESSQPPISDLRVMQRNKPTLSNRANRTGARPSAQVQHFVDGESSAVGTLLAELADVRIAASVDDSPTDFCQEPLDASVASVAGSSTEVGSGTHRCMVSIRHHDHAMMSCRDLR